LSFAAGRGGTDRTVTSRDTSKWAQLHERTNLVLIVPGDGAADKTLKRGKAHEGTCLTDTGTEAVLASLCRRG